MAKGIINLQKESGGITKISPVDGIGVTEVTVPESGELVTKEYVDTGAGVPFVSNDDRVKTALNANGNAPIYACRAWVNFKGTGTVAIRGSGNVSSITDNGTGDYTVNFTTAMPGADYACIATHSSNYGDNDGVTYIDENNYAAASVRLCSLRDNRDSYNLFDRTHFNVAIFR